jgi:hypothetical protein
LFALSETAAFFISGSAFESLVADQSPFATPFGQGLSSSTVNVLWGALNLVVAYILICRVGDFRLRSTVHVVTLGLGFLLIGLLNAHHFGRFHGGNSPGETSDVNR